MLQNWSDQLQVGIALTLTMAATEVSTKESKCAAGLLADVGNMMAPLEVFDRGVPM